MGTIQEQYPRLALYVRSLCRQNGKKKCVIARTHWATLLNSTKLLCLCDFTRPRPFLTGYFSVCLRTIKEAGGSGEASTVADLPAL